MRDEQSNSIDWWTILLYFTLVLAGWVNIFAADYNPDVSQSIFNLSLSSGKQLLWIGTSTILIIAIFIVDYRFYESFGYIIYGLAILLLIAVLFFGKEVAGSRSWFELGFVRLQPAEFAKIAALFGIAKYLGTFHKKGTKNEQLLISSGFFILPMLLIVLQGDAGSAMVYGSLLLVLFREGMSARLLIFGIAFIVVFVLTLLVNQLVLIIGILVLTLIVLGIFARSIQPALIIISVAILTVGLIKSVDFVLNDVLREHQQKRVMSLINPNADPLGIGWNVTQSKIAIGSGGLSGKGFLNGTQTKFDFVPEQTTDFIFCTIGEEHGWIGSTLLLLGFGILIIRIINIAERQKSDFVRIYGYGVASIIFFHFAINISMTIGLFPVIGIPLPFFSYGGSSLWSFTILLFVLLKLDSHRMQVLQRS